MKSTSKRSMHSDAISSENLRNSSYFVQQKREEEQQVNDVYQKVFRSLYWLSKEELPQTKICSLLKLLEKMGVTEITQFRTRSEPVLREMLIMMAECIREEIAEKINKSGAFGLLTDEVTDISNTSQLVTFAKYFDEEKGEAQTSFIGSSDILQDSEDTSANSASIFNSLVSLF